MNKIVTIPEQKRSGKLAWAYRPEIDGLRAIAVLAVVFYHAGLGCPGGYVGVDVFFVISGFLITALILRDLRADCFSLAGFWERRIRRILPALTVCVGATLIAGYFLLLPDDLEVLGKSAVAQALMGANFFFWRTTNYFGGANLEKPLLHTWSLAVEEQFYLLFPLLLMLLFRFPRLRRTGTLLIIMGTAAVASLVLSVWGVVHQPFAAFFLLPTRVWELLCGAIIAALPSGVPLRTRAVREIFSWAGLAAILFPVLLYQEGTPFPGLAAMPPCLGTAMVIWVNGATYETSGQATWASCILSLRPVVFVGLISYSLYLWHWPVMTFANYWKSYDFSVGMRCALVAISLVLAVCSWWLVELSFRQRRILASRRAVFAFAGCSMMLLIFTASYFVFAKGIPHRLPTEALAMLHAAEERQRKRQNATIFDSGPDPFAIRSDALPKFGNEHQNNRCSFLVWGDSHAKAAIPAFAEFAAENDYSGRSLVVYSTPPLVDSQTRLKFGSQNPAEIGKAVLDLIREQGITDVFLVAYWNLYQRSIGIEKLESNLCETINAIRKAGAVVWVVQDVPSYRSDVLKLLIRDKFPGWPGKQTLAGTMNEHQSNNQAVYELAKSAVNARFLDPAPLLLDSTGNRFRIVDDGIPLYYDNNHLTKHGATTILLPLLREYFNSELPNSNLDK